MKKTELARRLRVSRQTIYHWLAEGRLDRDLDAEPVRYSPRRPVPTKRDPYKGIIAARLGISRADCAAAVRGIRAASYPGGYAQLKAYVRNARPQTPAYPVTVSRPQLGWCMQHS